MDDPIFDPWCLDEASASQQPPGSTPTPSRWRNAAKGPPVPAQRPLPRPIERPVEEPDALAEAAEPAEPEAGEPTDETSEKRGGLDDLAALIADIEAASPSAPTPRSASTPARPARRADDPASFLGALLKPRIDALALRLTTARHRTTIDDRLEQDPPGLRFRIQPWAGPFDATEEQTAAVLELVLEGGRHGTLAVRVWLDPLSAAPTEQRTMAADRLTEAWVDRLLLDFVEQTLG